MYMHVRVILILLSHMRLRAECLDEINIGILWLLFGAIQCDSMHFKMILKNYSGPFKNATDNSRTIKNQVWIKSPECQITSFGKLPNLAI